VDAVYFGETYWASNRWQGMVYRMAIPWDWSDTNTYVDNPNDGSDPWTFHAFFDADRPVTAPVSLSLDRRNNTWVYFGTGRYISDDDKDDSNAQYQYIFGVVDPFFNTYYDGANGDYYHDYNNTKLLDINDLFEADDYAVSTDGKVFDNNGTDYFGEWDGLLVEARTYEGWYRSFTDDMERVIVKMTVLGGIVFVPSFIPNQDVCAYGGDSNLYGFYFETGTAFYNPIFSEGTETTTIDGEEHEIVQTMMSLGYGKSSALGVHVGQEEGAKAFIQQSTGVVSEADVTPAFSVKSGLVNWREK